MAKNTEPAFVLRNWHIQERTYFPGFPGNWMPGEPVALSDLGLTLEEAKARIEELGLPIEETTRKHEEAPQSAAVPEQPAQGDEPTAAVPEEE